MPSIPSTLPYLSNPFHHEFPPHASGRTMSVVVLGRVTRRSESVAGGWAIGRSVGGTVVSTWISAARWMC
jgi:hypothetical protein